MMPKITTDVKKDRDGFFTGQVVVWDGGTRLYDMKSGITRLTYADALEDAKVMRLDMIADNRNANQV